MKYIYDSCQVDFCTRDVCNAPKDAMYCKFHQISYERTGDPLNPDSDTSPVQCTVEDCNSPHLRRGLCERHYLRLKKYGSAVTKPKPINCSVEGCSRIRESRGLCAGHYQRLILKGSVGSADFNSPEIKPCAVPHCTKNGGLVGSVLCRAHRQSANLYSVSEQRFIDLMSTPCFGCGSVDNLSVDHDHNCCSGRGSCGECVRGSLCVSCNLVLGVIKDDKNVLERLIKYLS